MSRIFTKTFFIFFVAFIIYHILFFYNSNLRSDEVDKLPVIIQELVKPPFVPEHNIVAKGGPKTY